MKQLKQSYTAIETAYGFLFFAHTTEGEVKMQNFLQRMADHYFDPHFDLGPVHVYKAEGMLEYGQSVNPGEGPFNTYPYLKMDKAAGMVLEYQNEMKPTAEDFVSFCQQADCSLTHRNFLIVDTLNGIKNKERKLSELAGQGTAPEVLAQIKEITQDKSLLEKLLKQVYDVRGHRTVENILADPMDSVVVDGIRLFTPHRRVLAAGHGLFLPEEAKTNPSHSYAWINEDFTRIIFSKEPPGNKQVFKVKMAIEKFFGTKQSVKKKDSNTPNKRKTNRLK